MGRLIDADELLKQPIDTANYPSNFVKLAPTVEAIPKAEYEERLKDDLVAMVLEIQTEIDEVPGYHMTNNGICVYRKMEEYMSDVNNVIQKIIDGLREESEEEE